ncbi:hypothetical protein M405DRAFT_811954 [Rhizopogon salebrosus TDB-379]|nr:hypothetical protein M405DRAFT_811954 [Rhizopogon salebrosus TDB-379]
MFPLGAVTEERHADWTIGQYKKFQRDRHKKGGCVREVAAKTPGEFELTLRYPYVKEKP